MHKATSDIQNSRHPAIGHTIFRPVVITGVLLLLAILSLDPPSLWLSSIDFYYVTLVLITVIVPYCCAGFEEEIPAAMAGGAVVDTAACFWLWSVVQGPVGWLAWLGCYAILAAFAFALWSWTRFLRRWIGAPFAAVTIASIGFAFLTWPIWLSQHLSSQTFGLNWLVRLHPGLAINTALQSTYGIWSEQPFAYRFTNLNQDIAYTLPGIGWCIGGLILLSVPALVGTFWNRSFSRSMSGACNCQHAL